MDVAEVNRQIDAHNKRVAEERASNRIALEEQDDGRFAVINPDGKPAGFTISAEEAEALR